MSSQEVVTLQFGAYSNHVGTHYWNLQQKRLLSNHNSEDENEESECSKLFRESSVYRKHKYIPRMLCFDVKKSLRTLKEDGTFQEDENEVENTEGEHLVYAQSPIEKNEFLSQMVFGKTIKKLNLDDKVSTWTDYITYHLHENSIQLLTNNFSNGDDFNYFGLGQQEYWNLLDDIEDKLHFWVEECNTMEGFQILTDMHSGFCGISSKVLENLHDEYNKKCCLSFINWPFVEAAQDKDIYFDLNIAQTFQSFKEHSSLSVLQSLEKSLYGRQQDHVLIPNIEYKPNLLYHTSAILAAALDSTTLPWRQQNRVVSMAELCNHISQSRWKLAGTSFGIPMNFNSNDGTLFEKMLEVNGFYEGMMTSICPVIDMRNNVPSCHSIVLQNISEHFVIPSSIESNVLQTLGLNTNIFSNNPVTVLDYFNEKFYPCESTFSRTFYTNKKLDLHTPFPSIVQSNQCSTTEDITDVTTMSSLFTSANFYDLLHEVITRLRKINLNKHHIVQEYGLDRDLMNELQEDLLHLAQEYDLQRAFHELEL